MEILKVEHLTKVYGKASTRVIALDDVSFSVKKGEFVAIVGAIVIASLAVFVLISCIMKYEMNKISKQNTIETIRNENI